MREDEPLTAAIVDYGLGNLFSVQQACAHVGLRAIVTASASTIEEAGAVILPGVGAFGVAMQALAKLDLIGVLRAVAVSSKPLMGVCLGMQLLMSESAEFGHHQGLGIIEGDVRRLQTDGNRGVKVPQVGWNQLRVFRPQETEDHGDGPRQWTGSWLEGLPDGVCMYFVHSYYPVPRDPSVVLASTTYGQTTFASCVQRENVFACQFHPERSGQFGLQIYRNLAQRMAVTNEIGRN